MVEAGTTAVVVVTAIVVIAPAHQQAADQVLLTVLTAKSFTITTKAYRGLSIPMPAVIPIGETTLVTAQMELEIMAELY